MLKQVITTLKMVPIPASVNIPFVRQFIDEQGRLTPNEAMEQAATAMLDELTTWTTALEPIRQPLKTAAA